MSNNSTLYVWKGFPQGVIDRIPGHLKKNVRVVNSSNVPHKSVMLVHVDHLADLHKAGLTSDILKEYLDTKPVILFHASGVHYLNLCSHLSKWLFATVDESLVGLEEALCPDQFITNWDEILLDVRLPDITEEIQYSELTYEDFSDLEEEMIGHLASCGACRRRFENAIDDFARDILHIEMLIESVFSEEFFKDVFEETNFDA